MISVIVPVYNNIQITDDFFETICENTVIPSEIILVDNGSADKYYKLVKKYNHLNINYIRKDSNDGVNSAWNDGIRLSKTPYLSILNNDLLLNKYFFQKLEEVFNQDPSIGIVIPRIVKGMNVESIHISKDEIIKVVDIKRRNGCAFTIRKLVLDKIPPIPSELKTYCGDDYLFKEVAELGYRNVRMVNNFVFHYGSKTVLEVFPDKKTTRVKEKELYENIIIKS